MTATEEQIVSCFNAQSNTEILWHNWGTCGWDCDANWNVTDETYINGVVMTLDFDFMMGYLIQVVDRSTSRVRYLTVLQRHGRRADGTFDCDWEACPIEHTFYEVHDSVIIGQWAVSSIYKMLS